MWRRILVVVGGLFLGLALFTFGAQLIGTLICAAAFWLGYELLVTFDGAD